MKRYPIHESGMALPVVLVFLLMMSALVAMNTNTVTDFSRYVSHLEEKQNIQLAKAGPVRFPPPSPPHFPKGPLPWTLDIRLSEEEYRALEGQVRVQLTMVKQALTQEPPSMEVSSQRQMALLMLDGILRGPYARHQPSIRSYYASQIQTVAQEVSKTQIKDGYRLWKLYGNGVVVKTPTMTIGFDLVSGQRFEDGDFRASEKVFEKILSQCDVLFFSHLSSQALELDLLQGFLDIGRPVVLPAEPADPGISLDPRCLRLQAQAGMRHSVALQGGQRSVEVILHPSRAGDILNTMAIVFTPEKLCVMHTGSPSDDNDLSSLKDFQKTAQVDVLLAHPTVVRNMPALREIRPELIVPIGENDLSQGIDQRVSYWEMGKSIAGNGLVMTWGECYVGEKIKNDKHMGSNARKSKPQITSHKTVKTGKASVVSPQKPGKASSISKTSKKSGVAKASKSSEAPKVSKSPKASKSGKVARASKTSKIGKQSEARTPQPSQTPNAPEAVITPVPNVP